MLGQRALSGARVYRREPIPRTSGDGRGRKLNNRDVKTEREARESIKKNKEELEQFRKGLRSLSKTESLILAQDERWRRA
jgi:hypothetical protein